MCNSKYRVGDRVEYIGKYNGPNHMAGLQGHVIRVDAEGDVVVQPLVPNDVGTHPLWACGNIRKLSPERGTGHALPTDSGERKTFPMFRGLLAYFPAALARVSHHSFLGNEKHNAGKPLQHARGKSGDHEDCIVRHLVDAAEFAPGSESRLEELTANAWRSLALLQEECEKAGAPAAPAATFDAVS